jgi:hypothetical protein
MDRRTVWGVPHRWTLRKSNTYKLHTRKHREEMADLSLHSIRSSELAKPKYLESPNAEKGDLRDAMAVQLEPVSNEENKDQSEEGLSSTTSMISGFLNLNTTRPSGGNLSTNDCFLLCKGTG